MAPDAVNRHAGWTATSTVWSVPYRPDDTWLHLALIADAYERGGWPAPEGRIRPVGMLRGQSLAVPLLDGTWRLDSTPDPVSHAHTLGRWALVATAERAGFGGLVPVRRAADMRFGELTVLAGMHPRRIVVAGPNLPTVEITRHGEGEDIDPVDPIGTRRARQLTLLVNNRQGALLPSPGGSGRSAYDVAAVAWNRGYRMRPTGPEQAEVTRNDVRVARLLRGDPAPDRRYAVGWDPVADGIDRAMVHALASAFRVGAATFRERIRAEQRRRSALAAAGAAGAGAGAGGAGAGWAGADGSAQAARVLLERGVDGQCARHHQAEQRIW